MTEALHPALASDVFLADTILNLAPDSIKQLDLGAAMITCGIHPTLGSVVCINPCVGASAVVTAQSIFDSSLPNIAGAPH